MQEKEGRRGRKKKSCKKSGARRRQIQLYDFLFGRDEPKRDHGREDIENGKRKRVTVEDKNPAVGLALEDNEVLELGLLLVENLSHLDGHGLACNMVRRKINTH